MNYNSNVKYAVLRRGRHTINKTIIIINKNHGRRIKYPTIIIILYRVDIIRCLFALPRVNSY